MALGGNKGCAWKAVDRLAACLPGYAAGVVRDDATCGGAPAGSKPSGAAAASALKIADTRRMLGQTSIPLPHRLCVIPGIDLDGLSGACMRSGSNEPNLPGVRHASGLFMFPGQADRQIGENWGPLRRATLRSDAAPRPASARSSSSCASARSRNRPAPAGIRENATCLRIDSRQARGNAIIPGRRCDVACSTPLRHENHSIHSYREDSLVRHGI